MGFEDLFEVKVNVMFVFFMGLVFISFGNGYYFDYIIIEFRDDRFVFGINLY